MKTTQPLRVLFLLTEDDTQSFELVSILVRLTFGLLEAHSIVHGNEPYQETMHSHGLCGLEPPHKIIEYDYIIGDFTRIECANSAIDFSLEHTRLIQQEFLDVASVDLVLGIMAERPGDILDHIHRSSSMCLGLAEGLENLQNSFDQTMEAFDSVTFSTEPTQEEGLSKV